MENVGCVTYNDTFVERDEVFSDPKKERIYNVFMHEISHMWFGNLVTMDWWDDLWLNESFANFVSYVCLDEAPGLEEFKSAWSIFLRESFWGLAEDQISTTHPISVEVSDTDKGQNMFDGISYGKGAAWLNQSFHLFGREVFQKGIASYFKEFSWKNTKLEDFINHMDIAAKELKLPDFKAWSDTWLKKAGCNIISHTILEHRGVITRFTVNQKCNEHGDEQQI